MSERLDEERFKIMGSCANQGIDEEIVDYASDLFGADYLVREYAMAYRGWDIWHVDTHQPRRDRPMRGMF